MDIIANWDNQENPQKVKTVFTIGSFDGLHLGHKLLIDEVIKKAARQNASSLVLTFEPHPLTILAKSAAPPILTTFEQKAETLETWGLDRLGALVFNRKMAAMEPLDFLRRMIEKYVKPVEVVIGPDFSFGRNAEGGPETLRQWGREIKCRVSCIEHKAEGEDGLYSSSQIRQSLKDGLVDAAARALGRPYRLAGTVAHGLARGRLLGFPTANMAQIEQLVPGPGVYAVKARVRGETRNGLCSVGYNPTFGEQPMTVETHILDFEGDIYGQPFSIDFIMRLRAMQRFSSVEALVEQMKKDELTARACFDKLAATGA